MKYYLVGYTENNIRYFYDVESGGFHTDRGQICCWYEFARILRDRLNVERQYCMIFEAEVTP